MISIDFIEIGPLSKTNGIDFVSERLTWPIARQEHIRRIRSSSDGSRDYYEGVRTPSDVQPKCSDRSTSIIISLSKLHEQKTVLKTVA